MIKNSASSHFLSKAFGVLLSLTLLSACAIDEQSAVERHGALAVEGNQIVDQQGEAVALAGPSLFWANNGWGGEGFYNAGAVRKVAQDWHATLIRAAMGVDANGGYLEDQAGNRAKVETVVDAAIAEGIYVIIDWHSHHAEDHPEAAVEFFSAMAEQYGHQHNVIYEIYNEPLADVSWSETLKPYSEKVIAAIRAQDPDNLIVVGTPSWSQDVDEAAKDPITRYDNIVYALHFYAGTHKQELRDKAELALDQGLALMVTEWGTVNADGDGGVDKESTREWLEFMDQHNLSHANWALNAKDEGASMLKPDAPTDGSWTEEDLTESGKLVREIIRSWQ